LANCSKEEIFQICPFNLSANLQFLSDFACLIFSLKISLSVNCLSNSFISVLELSNPGIKASQIDFNQRIFSELSNQSSSFILIQVGLELIFSITLLIPQNKNPSQIFFIYFHISITFLTSFLSQISVLSQ